jgi:integrase/recombinase XerD
MRKRPAAKIPKQFRTDGDPQGMAALGNAFLEWCRVHNYSDCTTANLHRYIKGFIEWADLRGVNRPNEVTRAILERYQRWLFQYRKANGDPLTFSTQTCYLAPLRSWFKWLAKQNHILFNPASELELPKQHQLVPGNILTAKEAELVLAQPNVASVVGLRDRAILEVFYSTGMRRLEVAALGIYDIDRERGTVHIHLGKGRKDRVVPIGDRALQWVERYRLEARPRLIVSGMPTDVLFLTQAGEPIPLDRLTALVQQYVETTDIGKHGSCHMFRHTCATLMLENGCDLRYIQMMLGHANLNTTEIYTRVSIKKLVENHRATHPANMKPSPPHGQAVE